MYRRPPKSRKFFNILSFHMALYLFISNIYALKPDCMYLNRVLSVVPHKSKCLIDRLDREGEKCVRELNSGITDKTRMNEAAVCRLVLYGDSKLFEGLLE
jgi:hypothetical protein